MKSKIFLALALFFAAIPFFCHATEIDPDNPVPKETGEARPWPF